MELLTFLVFVIIKTRILLFKDISRSGLCDPFSKKEDSFVENKNNSWIDTKI